MYVTRPISRYYNNPQAAVEPPPEGSCSGILVVFDEEAMERATCFWGLWKDTQVYSLPFPQNRKLKVEYTTRRTGSSSGTTTWSTDRHGVVFIPVMNQPLSSNRYYVIRTDGKNIGKVSACSREEDTTTCCFCTCIDDVEPRPFDHLDMYQQVEVMQLRRRSSFRAKTVALDGVPPEYLRREGWNVYMSSSTSYDLSDAPGMDAVLRDQMPALDFGVSTVCSPPIVVARWYCPFMFVREGERREDQVRGSMFYELTLEQSWEQIYACENGEGRESKTEVAVSVTVQRATPLLNGSVAVQEGPEVVDGVMWLRPAGSAAGGLGLSVALWEGMRWELGRGGWVGDGDVERVERAVRFQGEGTWEKFGCYVLLERFVLRTLDGSLALTYEFKHTNKIRTVWQ